jgi:hypothetical protein
LVNSERPKICDGMVPEKILLFETVIEETSPVVQVIPVQEHLLVKLLQFQEEEMV